MTESFTWRDLLAKIIADPVERHRLADKLNVNPLTLTRWSSGTSMPRLESLHRLVQLVPEYEEQLRALIIQELPEFVRIDALFTQKLTEHISSALYREIISLWATISSPYRCRIITERLLAALLEQLDALQVGVVAMVALFTPPLPEKPVRSLHIFMGQMLPLTWQQEWQDCYPYLFGGESLTGYAIQTNRLQTLSNSDLQNVVHERSTAMQSAVACPMRAFSRLSGCLYVGSKQVDYFLAPKIRLIEAYAQLATLALDDCDFYEHEDISLSLFPDQQVQIPLVESVIYRMARYGGRMDCTGPNHLTPHQLELRFWQQLEQQVLDSESENL